MKIIQDILTVVILTVSGLGAVVVVWGVFEAVAVLLRKSLFQKRKMLFLKVKQTVSVLAPIFFLGSKFSLLPTLSVQQ